MTTMQKDVFHNNKDKQLYKRQIGMCRRATEMVFPEVVLPSNCYALSCATCVSQHIIFHDQEGINFMQIPSIPTLKRK